MMRLGHPWETVGKSPGSTRASSTPHHTLAIHTRADCDHSITIAIITFKIWTQVCLVNAPGSDCELQDLSSICWFGQSRFRPLFRQLGLGQRRKRAVAKRARRCGKATTQQTLDPATRRRRRRDTQPTTWTAPSSGHTQNANKSRTRTSSNVKLGVSSSYFARQLCCPADVNHTIDEWVHATLPKMTPHLLSVDASLSLSCCFGQLFVDPLEAQRILLQMTLQRKSSVRRLPMSSSSCAYMHARALQPTQRTRPLLQRCRFNVQRSRWF